MISSYLLEAINELSRFAQQGGDIVWILFFVSLLLWLLIVERYLFFYRVYPRIYLNTINQWRLRTETRSWAAHKIRDAIVSEHGALLQSHISTIKLLISLCPLLGLLGTVTGMVGVFEMISITGTSDAKIMSDGIYRATLPTMSGLVLALSALYFHYHLMQKSQRWLNDLSHHLLIKRNIE